MNSTSAIEADLATRVRQAVAAERAMVLADISLGSRLCEDLGMDGDDAWDFFREFACEFEVDLSPMQWRRHFGAEGLISLWSPDIPITVQDLVEAACAKRWLMTYPSKAK